MAAATSHARRRRRGRPACPGPAPALGAGPTRVGTPADSGAVAGPLPVKAGPVWSLGDQVRPKVFAPSPDDQVVAASWSVIAEADCRGGESSNGVASLAASAPSGGIGAPQMPQNRASSGTECLFMHVAMRITAPPHPRITWCMLGHCQSGVQPRRAVPWKGFQSLIPGYSGREPATASHTESVARRHPTAALVAASGLGLRHLARRTLVCLARRGDARQRATQA